MVITFNRQCIKKRNHKIVGEFHHSIFISLHKKNRGVIYKAGKIIGNVSSANQHLCANRANLHSGSHDVDPRIHMKEWEEKFAKLSKFAGSLVGSPQTPEADYHRSSKQHFPNRPKTSNNARDRKKHMVSYEKCNPSFRKKSHKRCNSRK